MKWLAPALLMLSTQVAAAVRTDDMAAYKALTASDARVATIGFRLATANAPFCKDKARNPGWVLHSIGQYEDQEAAKAAFGFDHGNISISALVPGGPAEKAGLSVDDDMVNLLDSRWFSGMHILPRPDKFEAENFRQALAELWARFGVVEISFRGAQGDKSLNFAPPLICASDFWVDTRNKADAGADGERVRVTTGMLAFIGDDDNQLAAVVAHELAHNLLGHRPRLDAVKKGKTKVILTTEVEADRLSVWLMANAGYDPKAALLFYQRYGRKYGLGIFSAGTHHRWKKRVEILQSEIDLMNSAEVRDGLRDPPLLLAYRNQQ